MEINRVLGNVMPVIANEDIVEGSFVCLTSHSFDNDFGSNLDLPGVKVPGTADEAKGARFIVTFAVDNRKTPIYQPMPSFSWALRQGGWDQASNSPFSATVYTTYPGYQHGKTIPSGVGCLAYGAGTFTIPSGQYIYSSGIISKGSRVSVSYTAPNKGKLQSETLYDGSVVVGFVERYDTANGDLTVTTGLF